MATQFQIHSEGPPAGDEVEPAFLALVRTIGLLRRVMEPYFARFGLSGAQWGVLRTLHRETVEADAKSLSLTDLGDRLLVRPPSVTGVVDRLQRMGLVNRTISDEDHRVKLVSLTPRGRKVVEQVLDNHPQHIANVLAGLDVGEQQALRLLLERLEPHLSDIADEAELVAAKAKAAAKRPVRAAG
jgi:MarR family 2-MHQ and catechol resistance regulon transcriptional repressor